MSSASPGYASTSAFTSFRRPLKAALDARKAVNKLEPSIFEPFMNLNDEQKYFEFRQRMENDPKFQIVGKPGTPSSDCIVVEDKQGLGPYDNPDMKKRLVNHTLYLGNLMLLYEQDVIASTLNEFGFVLQNAAINEQMKLTVNFDLLLDIANYFNPSDPSLQYHVTKIQDDGWCFYETVLTAMKSPKQMKGRHLAMCITWFIKNGTNTAAAFQKELDKQVDRTASRLNGLENCILTNGDLITILSVENLFDKKFAAIFPVTDIIGSVTSIIINRNIIIFNNVLQIVGLFKRNNDENVFDLQGDNNIYIQQLGDNHFNLIEFQKNPFTISPPPPSSRTSLPRESPSLFTTPLPQSQPLRSSSSPLSSQSSSSPLSSPSPLLATSPTPPHSFSPISSSSSMSSTLPPPPPYSSSSSSVSSSTISTMASTMASLATPSISSKQKQIVPPLKATIDSPATQQILEMLYLPSGRNLSKDAVEVMEYNQIASNPILFDEMLKSKYKMHEKAKCSEIFGFTTRTLTYEESVKFEIDSSKKYQIITNIDVDSIASITGLKVGDILIGMYDSDIVPREIFDFVDEDALYNVYRNKSYTSQTYLYICFRVLRYIKNFINYKLNYIDVISLPLKLLQHTERFALPFIINSDNTVINFGSVYFEKYIDELTDDTKQMIGGGKGNKAQGGPGPAQQGEAANEESPLLQQFKKLKEEMQELIQAERKMKTGRDKISVQEQILRYLYSRREFLERNQQQLLANKNDAVIQKHRGKKVKDLKPIEKAELSRQIDIKNKLEEIKKSITENNRTIERYENKKKQTLSEYRDLFFPSQPRPQEEDILGQEEYLQDIEEEVAREAKANKAIAQLQRKWREKKEKKLLLLVKYRNKFVNFLNPKKLLLNNKNYRIYLLVKKIGGMI